MIERVEATKKTLARFEGKPFDWSKSATCIHLIKYHVTNMGHQFPKIPRFRSPITAKRILNDMGHDSLIDAMDSKFPRIAPAQMMTGDVMAIPGDAGFQSMVIRASTTKYIGWHEDVEGCTIIATNMKYAEGAWRL